MQWTLSNAKREKMWSSLVALEIILDELVVKSVTSIWSTFEMTNYIKRQRTLIENPESTQAM